MTEVRVISLHCSETKRNKGKRDDTERKTAGERSEMKVIGRKCCLAREESEGKRNPVSIDQGKEQATPLPSEAS